MGTAIVSLLSLAVMLTSALMLTKGSFISVERVSSSLQQAELRIGDRARTR